VPILVWASSTIMINSGRDQTVVGMTICHVGRDYWQDGYF
jgi:hypothetical protein